MSTTAALRLAALTTLSTIIWAANTQTCPNAVISATEAARILEQGAWGPSASAICPLQQQGLEAWFNTQVDPSKTPVTQYPNQPLIGSDGKPFIDLSGVQTQFLENALNNPDQLRQRVAFALSEMWVVAHPDVGYAAAFPPLLNIFQNDAFGSYSKLIYDVTLNRAMGQYLNMLNNNAAVPPALPNENYARELMQLFTLGLNVLNPDGTLALDSQGQAINTFDPTVTVAAMSRVMTGWTEAPPGTKGYCDHPNYCGPMVPSALSNHDTKEKDITFTYPPTSAHPNGTPVTLKLPAGQTAAQDLYGSLDSNGIPTGGVIAALMQNPSLPPFVSQQLIQHLVTSNPSSQYVGRVALVFKNSGGNLQQVVRAILTDPEARAGDLVPPKEAGTFGHLREPMLRFENVLRGLNGQIRDASTLYGYLANLAQEPLTEPSVFSFFSPQFVAGNYNGQNLLGPEFQIYTTQTAIDGANYTYDAVYNGHLDANTTFDTSYFVSAATLGAANLTDAISNVFFHGQMSPTLTTAIDDAIAGDKTATAQAQDALYLALTSSEFLIIH